MTNAFKYAFEKEHSNPEINLSILVETGGLQIHLKDNGKGIEQKEITTSSNSFGMNLIQNFLDNIGAKMNISTDAGAHFNILVPTYK